MLSDVGGSDDRLLVAELDFPGFSGQPGAV